MNICVIAGDNQHYIHSLVQALAHDGLRIELIGGDSYLNFEFSPNVKCINLRGSQDPSVSSFAKLVRIFRYYSRCLSYIRESDARIIHLQSFRFNFLEGVILAGFYRMYGKRIVYTAHNVQPKRRNNKFNYLIFYLIFRVVNHVVCHTEKMKVNIINRYRISKDKISVIKHGLNTSIPFTGISQPDARSRIGIPTHTKVLLIFGGILPYKGVEVAFEALKILRSFEDEFVLLVAGGGSNNDQSYLQTLLEYVSKEGLQSEVYFYSEFIPDSEVELFFKAADVLLLPYTEANFQSGVLLLAYTCGLPVIASDVGGFPDEIENGFNGYVFHSKEARDLAAKVQEFYRDMHLRDNLRENIKQHAMQKYSRECISRRSTQMYQRLLHWR